ncbi:MAG: pilus assembly protein TadG-related protein [Terriglobia bacterium]
MDQIIRPLGREEGIALLLSSKIQTLRGKKEAGAVLYIVAAGLIVLLLFAGLAIDLSMLYNVKTDLQNAVDASALAGASQLDGTTNGINQAVNSAVNTTNNFHFNTTPVALVAGDVTFSATRDSGYVSQATAAGNPSGIRFVRVGARKTMDMEFMKLVPGGGTQDVAAFAVAGNSPPINTVCDGLLPLTPAPLKNASGGIDPYVVGQIYTLRFAGGNDNINVGSGNFLILDFSPLVGGNSGAALVRDLLAGGAAGCIGVGDTYCSKPGVSAGPVRQGLNTRFDSDTDVREGISHSVYTGNGRRILPLPIASRTPPPVFTAIDNGRDCPLYIYDVVCFFLQDRVSNGNVDVTGEFVGKCFVGEGKSDPGRPPSGGSGLPTESKLVLYR